ncbi:MAG: hypothetical protein HY332_05905 [Chloroflexi bacterium]|nr:hypothetical protein [Chloroflexota bacterium]
MSQTRETRPKVAIVATEWRTNSHTDVIVPKLLAGYDVDGQPVKPAVEVVSLYMDQFPENDLSRAWAKRFGVPIVPAVGEALTLGGSGLAVDAVLIVGEHGNYPWNEKGQHLYPRRELFEGAIEVIRAAGRPIPIFNDKHLSYSWENAKWMYDTARDFGCPFMAGSSLPVTFRDPELDLPRGVEIEEALVLSHGPTESYGFHALETLQCMVEYRRNGETGVKAVELLHGDAFWDAWEAGRFPSDLYDAALATTEHPEGKTRDFYCARPPTRSSIPGPHPPVAFLVEYRDGLRATLLNLSGYVRDFTFAARVKPLTPSPSPTRGEGSTPVGVGNNGGVVATAFRLEGGPPRWHFNFLAYHIEQFFLTGRVPYPVERTLLTTGTLAALMDAGYAGRRLETPHLAIPYEPPVAPWVRSRGKSLPPEQVWGFKPEDVAAQPG